MLVDGVYTIGPLRITFWDGGSSRAWGNSPFGITMAYKNVVFYKQLDGVTYKRSKGEF